MRGLWLAVLLSCAGCSGSEYLPEEPLRRPKVVVPDHVLSVFGGRLLGTDRGEWHGELLFESADGDLHPLLRENVRAIVRTPNGVYVFTGLAHLRTSEGDLYSVLLDASGRAVASRIGRLPGAPSNVMPRAEGSVTFLVLTNRREGAAVFECLALRGGGVSPGNDCDPPVR